MIRLRQMKETRWIRESAPMALSPLLPPSQLSGILNISIRTLERWRVEGVGPTYVKAGRRVLYRREDVERWLTEGTRHSTSDRGGPHA